jgi:hypothetical protein
MADLTSFAHCDFHSSGHEEHHKAHVNFASGAAVFHLLAVNTGFERYVTAAPKIGPDLEHQPYDHFHADGIA